MQKPLALLYILRRLNFRHVLCFTNSIDSTHRLTIVVLYQDMWDIGSGVSVICIRVCRVLGSVWRYSRLCFCSFCRNYILFHDNFKLCPYVFIQLNMSCWFSEKPCAVPVLCFLWWRSVSACFSIDLFRAHIWMHHKFCGICCKMHCCTVKFHSILLSCSS